MKIASGRKPGSDFRFNQIQESQDSHPLHKKHIATQFNK